MSRLSDPPGAIRVTAPARLHLGFLDPSGSLGRHFGGLGLAIDAPAVVVRAARATGFQVSGPSAERAERVARAALAAFGLPDRIGMSVDAAIPAHAGLGSGTQLDLAVASACLAAMGERRPAADIASHLGRGRRSAIGIAAFEAGGFILDGGRGPLTNTPPLLARLAFPAAWRVILVRDPSREGMHGPEETAAFERLPPLPRSAAAELCHDALLRVLPGVAEADLTAFGEGVTAIQARLGEHFAPVQGGRWTSPAVGRMCARLAERGAVGIGQSSWGPTGFAFVASEAEAAALTRACADEARGAGLELSVARGRNEGARTEPIASTAAFAVRRVG